MRITHGRVSLELHELAHRAGPSLLLLHALYGSSGDWGEAAARWTGSVYALDFCGHGRSDWVRGGAYYPELLLGDADVALAAIGRAALAGAGVGAYVALLLAGARSDQVPAALLLPGAGLAGAGAVPDFEREFPDLTTAQAGTPAPPISAHAANGCDPLVSATDLSVRPVDYAAAFAGAGRRLFLVDDDDARPPWWEAAGRTPSAQVIRTGIDAAFGHLLAAAE